MQRKWLKARSVTSRTTAGPTVDRDGRRDQLQRRKGQIEARLASLNARDEVARRKQDIRANIILGALIRAHAASHPAFMPTLLGILSVGARRRPDRELLATVLGLPQLVADTTRERKSKPKRQPAVEQPHRPRWAAHAAEITARR